MFEHLPEATATQKLCSALNSKTLVLYIATII